MRAPSATSGALARHDFTAWHLMVQVCLNFIAEPRLTMKGSKGFASGCSDDIIQERLVVIVILYEEAAGAY